MAEGYEPITGIAVSTAWIATQSSAHFVHLTNDLVIPEKGLWLIIVNAPYTDGTSLASLAGNITSINNNTVYFHIKNQSNQCALFNVPADNTTVYLQTNDNAPISYTLLERAFLTAVKLR